MAWPTLLGCRLCVPWPRAARETRSLRVGHDLYGRGAIRPGKNAEPREARRGAGPVSACGRGRRFLAEPRALRELTRVWRRVAALCGRSAFTRHARL